MENDQKNKKPPPHRFKPGWSGGPGRPKKSEEQKVASKLTRLKAEQLLTEFTAMDIAQLEAVLKDKNRTVLEHWVGRICLMGIKGGDERKLTFMFDRLIGKVKDEVEVKLTRPFIVENLEGAPKLLGVEVIDAEVENADDKD